ncbi:MAG: hypothetical protein HUU10_09830 [Bacteroidetes bacterium]|nr:hypothetical protein [Bacteroidota bacterium]
MILFNLKALESRLKNREMTQPEYFRYLMANWLVLGTLSFLVVDDQWDNPGVAGMLLIIPAVGVLLGYRSNRKGDNADFLNRFIKLHFVIGMRFFLLSIAVVLLVALIGQFIPDHPVKGFILGGSVMAVMIGFYGSLARSVGCVAGR